MSDASYLVVVRVENDAVFDSISMIADSQDIHCLGGGLYISEGETALVDFMGFVAALQKATPWELSQIRSVEVFRVTDYANFTHILGK